MIIRHNSRDLLSKPLIVGTVPSPESLKIARKLKPGPVDVVELRVDHFAPDPKALLAAAGQLAVPSIVTVRHPAEGGQHDLTPGRRRELYANFLPHAAFIDLELRSAKAFAGTMAAAKEQGTLVILSAHDFQKTPSEKRLREVIRQSQAAGADICKIAARADTVAQLDTLLGLLAGKLPLPLSVMAMGRFGKVSRLLFAQAGSVLNYGYLAAPNASGQWPAAKLKERLAELEG